MMNPYELFELCRNNVFNQIDTCGGSVNLAILSGELCGVMSACSYMEDADNEKLADMLNKSLAQLRERGTSFIAEGVEDVSERFPKVLNALSRADQFVEKCREKNVKNDAPYMIERLAFAMFLEDIKQHIGGSKQLLAQVGALQKSLYFATKSELADDLDATLPNAHALISRALNRGIGG